MSKCVLVRACRVYVILTVIIIVCAAYYHYTTNATTDYICSDETGSLVCNPADSSDLSYFNEPYRYMNFHIIERYVGDNPRIHVSKQYLVSKYPFNYGGLVGSESELSKDRKAAHFELSLIKKDLEYYESRYIEEAIKFAFKWAIVFPSAIIAVMFLGFSLKNYILHGTFKVSFK